MNLFRPALKNDFFDVVISNGVLHHTNDCRAAFGTINKLVKPGGYLIVGLYHWYSRKLVHYPRRQLVRWVPALAPVLDPHFAKIRSQRKHDAGFATSTNIHMRAAIRSTKSLSGWRKISSTLLTRFKTQWRRRAFLR